MAMLGLGLSIWPRNTPSGGGGGGGGGTSGEPIGLLLALTKAS